MSRLPPTIQSQGQSSSPHESRPRCTKIQLPPMQMCISIWTRSQEAFSEEALSRRWIWCRPSVGLSVGPFVRSSVRRTLLFWVFAVFGFTAPAQINCDLNYSPCPPARDWGSRVSGLVHIICDLHNHMFFKPFAAWIESMLKKENKIFIIQIPTA